MEGPIGYTNTVDITEKGYTGHMRSDTSDSRGPVTRKSS